MVQVGLGEFLLRYPQCLKSVIVVAQSACGATHSHISLGLYYSCLVLAVEAEDKTTCAHVLLCAHNMCCYALTTCVARHSHNMCCYVLAT